MSVNDQAHDISFEPVPGGFSLIVDGASYVVMGEAGLQDMLCVSVNGVRKNVTVQDERTVALEKHSRSSGDRLPGMEIRAPMPGLVVKVLAEPGMKVERGEGLIILEAMKMENELRTAENAKVNVVLVKEGDTVAKNQLLIELS